MQSNLIRLTCAVITILSWMQLSSAQNARCFKRNPRLSTDGCSVPIFKKFPYKKLFEPACNRHDICYICAIKFLRNRLYCDLLFLHDMRKRCKERYRRLKRVACRIAARKVYYKAVRAFGWTGFKLKPRDECKQSWVQSCLP